MIYPHLVTLHDLSHFTDLQYDPSSVWAEMKGKEELLILKTSKISCLSDGAQTTVKTDGGPDTQSDVGNEHKKVKKMSFLSSVFDTPFHLVSFSSYVAIIYKRLCVTVWFICGIFSLSVQTTMQLGSIMLSEWHGDVSEATERQGQPQHLRLSRLTKGSCNCFGRATDCTVAVNVTGYNGRRFSDTELRGQRSRGPPKVAAPGLTGAARSGAVWSQLGFPVAFAPLCQLSESVRTKWLLQQLSGKTLQRTDQCLHKGSSSAYCLALVNHSYDLWCYCSSTIMTSHNTFGPTRWQRQTKFYKESCNKLW